MTMRLIKFRVTNFRSVEDSGWIETDEVTALIGTNESGKTNLLLPLWKLHPAKDGEINLLADAPRNRYHEIKNLDDKPVFVEAHFELPDALVEKLVVLTGAAADDVRVASVSRKLDGKYLIGFPDETAIRDVPKEEVVALVAQASAELGELAPATKAEEGLKEAMHSVVTQALAELAAEDGNIGRSALERVRTKMGAPDTEGAAKRSTLAPRYGQLLDAVDDLVASVSKPLPSTNAEASGRIRSSSPSSPASS